MNKIIYKKVFVWNVSFKVLFLDVLLIFMLTILLLVTIIANKFVSYKESPLYGQEMEYTDPETQR